MGADWGEGGGRPWLRTEFVLPPLSLARSPVPVSPAVVPLTSSVLGLFGSGSPQTRRRAASLAVRGDVGEARGIA